MTPDEQIAVIRAKAEGKKIYARWKNPERTWFTIANTDDFDFQKYDYRIAPSPIASGHNPDKLTVEQVGEGKRTLSEEELVAIEKGSNQPDIEFYVGHRWIPCCNGYCFRGMTCTYRTQKPEGYFLPKKTVKVEMEWTADDVPMPICWVKSCHNKSAAMYVVISIEPKGVRVGFSGYLPYSELFKHYNYSTDGKTWLPCKKVATEGEGL